MIKINQETDALGVIDMQRDFNGDDPNAPLGVFGASKLVYVINRLTDVFKSKFASRDAHSRNHKSFAETHGLDNFTQFEMPYGMQTLWPVHCVRGTRGADYIDGLVTDDFFAVIYKGMNPEIDSYSAFFENDRVTATGLGGLLKERGLTRLFFVGIAKYHCVAYSCLDAARLGFEVYLIDDASVAIDDQFAGPEEQEDFARQRLLDAGVKIITTADLEF